MDSEAQSSPSGVTDKAQAAAASPPPNNPLYILQCYLNSLDPLNGQDESSAQQQARLDQVLRVADFLFNNSIEGALAILDSEPPLITKVISTASNRSAFLVQGTSQRSKSDSETYLCYISPDCTDPQSMHHCSCRSFWDKSRTSGKATLCKHLLALHLMPVLGVKSHLIEVATDKEFAKIVLSRLRIDY